VSLPYRAGQFVWCRFPNRERPDRPGPKSRVGYVYAVTPSGQGAAAMLYTTTALWPGPNLPLGVVPVGGRHAAALGQKAFTIDVRTVAVLPVTAEYFPRLDREDHGVRGQAPIDLVRRIEAILKELHRRGVVIEVRGPKST
jgi:hypothetical protein